MSQYKKFVKDIGIFGIATFLTGLEGFILIPILTKNLGAFDYGVWSQVKITIAFLAPLVFFGIRSSLVRYLTGIKNQKKIDKGVSTATIFSIFSGAIFSIALYLVSPYISMILLKTPEATIYFQAASVLILLKTITGVFNVILTFKENYSLFSISNIILASSHILLVALFIFRKMGLFGVIFAFIIAQILVSFFSYVFSRKYYNFVKPSYKVLGSYLAFGIPMTFVPILQWVFQVGDQYILGYYHGAEIVGLYAVVYSISYILRTLASPVLTILVTSVTSAWNRRDIKAYRTYFEYSYKYLFLVLIPGAFGIIFLAKPIILLLTTEEFLPAAQILPFLVIGILIFTLVHLSNTILRIRKKTKTIMHVFLFLALSNLILNFILVPRFHLYGAAIATLITFIAAAFHSIYVIKKNKMKLMPIFILKSLFASAVMSIFIYYARRMHIGAQAKLIMIIPVSVIIYSGIMLLLKTFKKKEIKFFKSFIYKKKAVVEEI
jgi:O-antigen/teichoic acid export membrane protein